MLPKKVIITSTIVLSLLPLQVFAQTDSQTMTLTKANDTKVTLRDLKPTIQVYRDEKHASKAATREAIKDLLEQKKGVIEQQRIALKTQINAFKDQRKKELVLKLDTKIASMSSRRTDKMSDAVVKLQDILTRIKTKAAQIPQAGCDTTALTAAITRAETAVASASSAVQVQASKTYPVTVTTEQTARQTVGATIKQLETDLRDTHKAVVAAKQAVQKAAMELNKTRRCAKITGFEDNLRPTTSITPTVTTTVTATPTASLTPTMTVTPTLGLTATPTVTPSPTAGVTQ